MGIANVFRSFRLPTHWHVRTDEEGKDFYWNSHTFKKQSKKPTALPMGWHEQINLETREVYIYNILTRQSRAAPPERQVQQPPPERLSPPPPTIEMYYEESVRQSRRQLAQDRAAARTLQIDGGASPRRQGGCSAFRALDTTKELCPGAGSAKVRTNFTGTQVPAAPPL